MKHAGKGRHQMSNPEAPVQHDDDSSLEAAVRLLIEQGRTNNRIIANLQITLAKQTTAIRWRTGVLALVLLLIGIVVLNNSSQIRASEQKLCPMIELLVPQHGEPAPSPGPNGTLSRAQIVAAKSVKLSRDYRCPR
jgi:hypothetical protein